MNPDYCPDPNCKHCDLVRQFRSLYGDSELEELDSSLETLDVLAELTVNILRNHKVTLPDTKSAEIILELMTVTMNYGYVLGRTKPREPVPEVFTKADKQ